MATQRIRIKLKSYDHNLVDLACNKIVEAAEKMGSKVSGPIPLPTEKEIVTVLRATHKYKDAREQFELRTYKRQNGRFAHQAGSPCRHRREDQAVTLKIKEDELYL